MALEPRPRTLFFISTKLPILAPRRTSEPLRRWQYGPSCTSFSTTESRMTEPGRMTQPSPMREFSMKQLG